MRDRPLTLLCLSHLRWDHVWQRPQQLMTRFADHCRVVYVDPPEIATAEQPHLQSLGTDQGVEVYHPIFPEHILDSPGHSYRDLWLALLPTVLEQCGPQTMLWVSSPLANYLVSAAREQVILAIYDCMDDLASFRDGTPDMRRRETHLFELVDLVFTGGHSMYAARKQRHPHVHCFPSGVDVDHYSSVTQRELAIPAAVAHIPSPRLGYFGVLDERIDWPLIAAVAERRPRWQWLLVGPTAKIEPDELPVCPNIHYLGQQPYRDLPAFLKSFDVATMPFALNEATRRISPTKTLEYLAGGKPVISTSVPDVVALYKDIVAIEDGAAAWIQAIERILAATPAEQQMRAERARPIIEQSTWDQIVDRMWVLIQERLPQPS